MGYLYQVATLRHNASGSRPCFRPPRLNGNSRDEALLQIAAADNDLNAMAEAIITIDNPDVWGSPNQLDASRIGEPIPCSRSVNCL